MCLERRCVSACACVRNRRSRSSTNTNGVYVSAPAQSPKAEMKENAKRRPKVRKSDHTDDTVGV